MTNEQMNLYKMRISQAGVGELTVVMLEMEIQWIEDALAAYEQEDMETFLASIEKAQLTQVELMNVLNMSNPIAVDVYSVFAFINKELITAKIKQKPLDIARCKALLARYHKSFQEVAKTDKGGPIMERSEKVYAGLTYGSKGLVESTLGGTEYSV